MTFGGNNFSVFQLGTTSLSLHFGHMQAFSQFKGDPMVNTAMDSRNRTCQMCTKKTHITS